MEPTPNDTTIASYEAAASRYRDLDGDLRPRLRDFVDRFAERVGVNGHVLELGSGAGRDARYLEERGLRVQRTDATGAFVELLRADGHDAQQLDIRRGHFGGPWSGIYANAVLLHLDRTSFRAALVSTRRAVTAGGVLGITLKEGDGEGWTTERLDVPRWFVYWREPDLRRALEDSGWIVERLDRVVGEVHQWLQVIARADGADAGLGRVPPPC